jgi:peptidase E
LAGLSAGLICWFECSVTDSFGPPTALHDGLGLIAGSACPHYAAQGSRGAFYRSLIAAGLPAGYGVDDGAALHFEDTHLVEVVSSRAQACAYHVSASADGVQEERLAPRFLGA